MCWNYFSSAVNLVENASQRIEDNDEEDDDGVELCIRLYCVKCGNFLGHKRHPYGLRTFPPIPCIFPRYAATLSYTFQLRIEAVSKPDFVGVSNNRAAFDGDFPAFDGDFGSFVPLSVFFGNKTGLIFGRTPPLAIVTPASNFPSSSSFLIANRTCLGMILFLLVVSSRISSQLENL
uniref:Yippee domain-containing protein n=1 Tax=Cucumis melo TaxID=3656 RepID=A0A9I9EKN7_CUCME